MEHAEEDKRVTDAWFDYMRQEGSPKNTIISRQSTIRSLPNALCATREEVEAWWAGLSGLAPATKSTMLSNLRAFYKWCSIWEHREDDPTRRIATPKVPNNLPRPISKPDLAKLMAEAPPDLKRAAILGAWAGLRVSECAALRWDQVNFEMNTIDIVGTKGGKSRRIKVAGVLIDSLLPISGVYVVTGTDKEVSAKSLQQRVNRLLRRVCGEGMTFHRLRHRYGSLAYQETGDIVAVGKMMGHASIISTAVYAQANDDVASKIAMAVTR